MTDSMTQKEEDSVDSLSERVDSIRKQINGDLDPQKRSSMGQYLTSASVASFMASMIQKSQNQDIKLLDPGAGIGSLTAAFVDKLCQRLKPATSLMAITYELEPRLIMHLQKLVHK